MEILWKNKWGVQLIVSWRSVMYGALEYRNINKTEVQILQYLGQGRENTSSPMTGVTQIECLTIAVICQHCTKSSEPSQDLVAIIVPLLLQVRKLKYRKVK